MIKSETLNRLLKKLRRVLVAMLVSFIVINIYFVWDTYEDQFYSSEETQVVCSGLNLMPESPFCHEVERNNDQTLENALAEHYPINSTTLNDLRNNFNLPMKCSMQKNINTNSCPDPENCQGNYECSVSILSNRMILYITFNVTGEVENYNATIVDS